VKEREREKEGEKEKEGLRGLERGGKRDWIQEIGSNGER